jgi:hypothetical protein
MNPIGSLLGNFYEVKRPRSERACLIQQFVDRLISERGDKNFYMKDGKKVYLKPITSKSVAIRLGYIKTQDLYYVYSICKDAKSFEKMFWFMTKTKVLA